MQKKLCLALAVGALAPFTLAACGGDDEEPAASEETTEQTDTGGSGGSVDISAVPDGSFAYEQDAVEAAAGEVTINFDNPATLGHDVQVEGPDGDLGGTDVISEDSTTVTVNLEAGDYTFYCSVAGHREGGMEGDLAVE